MSVKSFKFVSPGVFINEIDNSFIPRSSDAIGPVVVGRSTRGLALQPVQVQSYSEFVEMFGDTVPGGAGGDVSRDGNYQSPMYGTYAAKAFLVSNVAPLTYIRLLGEESGDATADGKAGWETVKDPATTLAENGGAYGLFLFPSASFSVAAGGIGTGSLAAVFYLNKSASIQLSGNLIGSGTVLTSQGIGRVMDIGSDGLITAVVTSSIGSWNKKIKFGFDDSADTFIRKVFSTNPQLASDQGAFYPSSSFAPYWLGETFEQEVRDAALDTGTKHAVILPLALDSAATTGPHENRVPHQEANTGWFIGQDLDGVAAGWQPQGQQKLFRLIGRGHGEWLNKNVKVSIEKIRSSTTTTTDYGTFSVVLRRLNDTDNRVQVLERFDNLTLDPSSPNFVARKIGNTYAVWDETQRRLKTYGDYQSQSKYVYVECNPDVEEGASNALYLPFGYFGPPKYSDAKIVSVTTAPVGRMIHWASSLLGAGASVLETSGAVGVSGSLVFPSVRLRVSASDGGLADARNAYFGMMNTRTAASTRADLSVGDVHGMLDGRFLQSVDTSTSAPAGSEYAYVFSLNDVRKDSGTGYYYESGSFASGDAVSISGGGTYKTLLDAGYDKFTAPVFGGFDGLDLIKPDPFYNAGLTSASETTSSPYYTLKRSIDTVADPESLDMNLMAVPGLTNDTLTTHLVNICEDRADAMSIIDLSDVYTPAHESYIASRAARRGSGVDSVTQALKGRRIDSSYGATFYPWVQTRDDASGRLLWIPPSVAMLGVLASSQASTHLWYAPAGFNRGGLSDGAAGIPVTNVTERLTSKERDKLYDANINPIASFPSTGIVAFGQKTLQERQSALDRINVRRLVIYLKKQISVLSTQVLFEQNVQSTWNRFKSLVEPFLANVKVQFGITDYRLILDETTTTPDLIDQNIMYAKIMVKPARAIEYIAIDFVVASTGASFDD